MNILTDINSEFHCLKYSAIPCKVVLVHAKKAYGEGAGSLTTLILNLDTSWRLVVVSVISGFRRQVDDSCALQGDYADSSGNLLPTFRDNRAVPSSRANNPYSI
jgi:hypothetical protein